MSKSKYTKPELREKLKKRIMAGSRGGKPGQWSARKAQLLAQEYRKQGGGYRGGKGPKQRSLSKWTSEEWTTSDGKPAIREGGTNRYLPKKAWDKLTPTQRAATNRKKRQGSRAGRQFVANTERARDAGRSARRKKSLQQELSPVLGGDDRTKWDERVSVRLAAMNMRADQISERVGIDVKALPKLSKLKPESLSPGARTALRSGAAIVDELGFMRCPPGTANAMQFTDFRGSNCGIAGAPATRRLRFRPNEAVNEFGEDVIKRRSSFVSERLAQQGVQLGTPSKRRKRLADSVKRLFGDSAQIDSRQANLAQIIRNHGGGFSWNLADGTVISEGYAIARPGRGFRLRASDMVDANGNPTEEAKTRMAQLVAMNATDFTTTTVVDVDGNKVRSSATVLGGWKSDLAHDSDGNLLLNENGDSIKFEDAVADKKDVYEFFYFDLTDIFDEEIGDETAYQIGKERNQQSVAKLSAINSENFDSVDIESIMQGETGGFINTEGTGTDVIDARDFDGMVANAVSLLGPDGKFESVIRSIAGEDTLDIENFDDAQVQAMMKYMSSVQGFEWIDPDDPNHMYLAIMQLSDNLLNLMDATSLEDRQKWAQWYDIANRFSTSLADELDLPEQSMAAITAILSPQKDWDQNMAMAEHLARLMSDDKFVVPGDVAIRALNYAEKQWDERHGDEKQKGSYLAKIAQLQKLVDQDQEKLKSLRERPQNRATERYIRLAEARVANYREQIEDINGIKEQDSKPTITTFAGRSLADLSDRDAANVVRAHSEMYGGQYLGQPELKLTEKEISSGVYATRLATWKISPTMSGEAGEYTVESGGKKVAATSFTTYEAAVAAFRSDGDMEAINDLLGSGSKVRSFYNNIAFPNDKDYRDVTVDTHAVAGLTLIPVGAKHTITNTAFSTVDSLGAGQAYPLYRAAMIAASQRWAEKTGEQYLPRQIQSITWESIRSLIPAEYKKEPLISRMAQLQRLSKMADADPRFSGENTWNVALEYIAIANMKTDEIKKTMNMTKAEAYDAVAERYGLPALTAADKMAKAK